LPDLLPRVRQARLAWGYVDHPPLSIGVLAATRALVGTSPLAIRTPTAMAVGGAVVVTALLATRLGGGFYAQSLAALCTATSSMALVMGSFYWMNA
jgi:predicted membrane-bound dolichyl-phosphate-mannose-protein mannosyltransferase